MADTNKKKIFTDERTRSKIDLHLRDINDEITENDIANIKTDVTMLNSDEDDTVTNEASDMVNKIKIKDEKNHTDGNNSNDVESSWNVLGERD